jgi:hypothetical protein
LVSWFSSYAFSAFYGVLQARTFTPIVIAVLLTIASSTPSSKHVSNPATSLPEAKVNLVYFFGGSGYFSVTALRN